MTPDPRSDDEPTPTVESRSNDLPNAGDVTVDVSVDDYLELAAEMDLVRAENRRLRSAYARTRRHGHRVAAVGLAAVGLFAVAGGLVLPGVREVLFSIAAAGLLGSALTFYLTPGQFVAASVGDRLYAATATNLEALADDLGLQRRHRYVPGDETTCAWLFVPRYRDHDLPDPGAGPLVTEEGVRGLVLVPTGTELFEEFERTLVEALASNPDRLGAQLCDGLCQGLELVETASADIDADRGRATVAITDSVIGGVDRFDHPVASFLAVGFTVGLDRPVSTDVHAVDADGANQHLPIGHHADWLVTCRWDQPAATDTDASMHSNDGAPSNATDA